jgi:hypothetical protein
MNEEIVALLEVVPPEIPLLDFVSKKPDRGGRREQKANDRKKLSTTYPTALRRAV